MASATAGDVRIEPIIWVEHAAHNVISDPDEIARFFDRCSEKMRELLGGLSRMPDTPRPFPEIEESIGWPRRRIASVLGGVSHLRHTEFAGRRPYHFLDARQSASRRWEMWMDGSQAQAVREVMRLEQIPEPRHLSSQRVSTTISE